MAAARKRSDGATAEKVILEVTAPSEEPSKSQPKGMPPAATGTGKEQNRERTGTFDSLESKLARWESMGGM